MIWRLALGLLVAGAIVVIGLQIRENTGETGATGPTLILVEPDRTPLPRDSGPENNAPRKKGRVATRAVTPRRQRLQHHLRPQSPTRTGAKRRSPARKPPKAHSPPRRPDSPEKPQPPPSAPPQEPPPVVTVPSPKVCVNGLVEVGDCG